VFVPGIGWKPRLPETIRLPLNIFESQKKKEPQIAQITQIKTRVIVFF